MFDPRIVVHIDKQIQAMADEWRRAIDQFQRTMAAIDWDGFLARVGKASEQLADLGWTLPMGLSPPEVIDLAGVPIDKVDAFLVAHYTAQDFAALRRVRSELLPRPSLSAWRGLLKECFEVFENGKHLVTVPALISTIEGVVACAGNSLHKQNVSRKFLAAICADKAKASPRGIKALMWHSLEIFVEKVFQDAPFDKSRPAIINRHWILHGRDSPDWTVADSLRLFCALETIHSLLE
jgi:hypothetical protein